MIDPQYPVTTSRMPYKARPDNQGGYFVAYDESGTYGYYAMLARVDSNGIPASTVGNVGGGQHGVWAGSWFPASSDRTHGQLVMGPMSAGNVDIIVATINKFDNGQPGVAVVELSASGLPFSSWWQATNVQPTYRVSQAGFVGSSPAFGMWGPDPEYGQMPLVNPISHRPRSWLGGTAGGFTEMVGPSFLSAISQWPAPGGNPKGTNSSARPNWVHFLPLDNYNKPQFPPKSADALQRDIESYFKGSLGTVQGSHTFHKASAANHWQFGDEVGYSENDAVSFFGHSSGYGNPQGATGLVLYDDWALVKSGFSGPSQYPWKTINVSTIPSAARIIVIANCDVKALFKGLWEIGPGRALIYTRGTTDGRVNLSAAAVAWGRLMQELSAGRTVAEAVATANAYINENIPVGSEEHFEYAFDQGGDVRLVR